MNKKALYESIMKDVSKIVKKHLNENIDDTMTLADMVQCGIDDGTLEFIGTANDIPVVDLNAAYNYIETNFPESYDFSDENYGAEDLYDDLVDLCTPEFCVYDPDVLWQLSTGSDGLADDGFDPDNYVVY